MTAQASEGLLEGWTKEYENDPEFIAEELSSDVIDETLLLLGNRTQTWLANQMHVSRAHVSKVLSAPPNLTLLSIARIGVALGVKPRVILDGESYYIKLRNEISDYGSLIEDFTVQQSSRFDAQSTANIVQLQSARYVDASS